MSVDILFVFMFYDCHFLCHWTSQKCGNWNGNLYGSKKCLPLIVFLLVNVYHIRKMDSQVCEGYSVVTVGRELCLYLPVYCFLCVLLIHCAIRDIIPRLFYFIICQKEFLKNANSCNFIKCIFTIKNHLYESRVIIYA